MDKDYKIYCSHIIESISLIRSYLGDKNIDDFKAEIGLQDMVIRRLEIIGEAVKNIPENVKGQKPDIPWKQIAGMRDKLIHHYFGVDIQLIWNTVTNDLPHLLRIVTELLNDA
ncbi:MAG: DUF86 domain-containing protein [Spirochaetales bacterium]|nr:DUF86 domain-containing protein [Spirochaetales bacterium]